MNSSHITRRHFLRALGGGAALMAAIPPWLKAADSIGSKNAEHPARPNILFLFPDQWRPDWVGYLKQVPVRTPNLDALAARGTVCTGAITPSPLCAPARGALAMGLEYAQSPIKTNEDCVPLGGDFFYKRLREAGYYVMGCGKFDLSKGAADWGADGKHRLPGGTTRLADWGFNDGIDNSGKFDAFGAHKKGDNCPYLDFLKKHSLLETHLRDFQQRKGKAMYGNSKPTPLPDFAYADNWITRNATALLESAPPGKPWFLQVNFNGPHNPVDVTSAMRAAWKDASLPLPHPNKSGLTDEELLDARRNYAAMIENIDKRIGELIALLRKRGELERTLIIFSSDHGEMLGDHGRFAKSVPWEASAGVPLLASGPGVKAGAVLDGPCATLDLGATFLDYAGLGTKFHQSLSLRKALAGEEALPRRVVHSGLGRWRMAFDGRYVLFRDYPKNGETHFYDLRRDPDEQQDVPRAGEAGAAFQELEKSLAR